MKVRTSASFGGSGCFESLLGYVFGCTKVFDDDSISLSGLSDE